jgi:hypothetical protein
MDTKDGQNRRRSPKNTKPTVLWEELAPEEQLSVVCRLFCEGNNPTTIARQIKKDYAAKAFTRQSTYPLLLKAADAGWLRFVPKASYMWSSKLRDRFNWLADVKVVHTNEFEDVAYQGAQR